MARVSEAEVKEIIETTKDLTAHIKTATAFVDTLFASSTLSAAHLMEIERWLAAHFAALTDQEEGAIIVEEHSDHKAKYVEVKGEGLSLTRYGQQAIVLDTSGTLATVSKTKARFQLI